MPIKETVEQLEKIRTNMMQFEKEAKDRAHEPQTDVHALRMWYHLMELEIAVRTISWALMREIDPHAS